jgi:hypothetical protein
MNAYTKGPWTIGDESEDNAGQRTLGITSDNRPGYICGIHCADGVDLDCIDRANARLIAAAPDLLIALRNMVADWERVMRPIPHDHEAKAAIAHAEGRTS